MDTRKYGAFAEEQASRLLIKKGYKIIDRNYRTRYAEIDIVATDNESLVFVEVKARRNSKFGAPEEAVTPGKIRKIIKAGELYALSHTGLPKRMRLEVVSLLFEGLEIVNQKIIKVY